MQRNVRAFRLLLASLALFATIAGCTTVKRLAYEGFGGRESWQQPERVIAALELLPGQKVADVGSGGGYFSFRLAEAVGPDGRVYAVDVDEGMNDYVARQASKRGLANLHVVLASEDDAGLPERVDLVFSSNTYHHLSDRVSYFRRLRETHLLASARVAIVEFRASEGAHATSRELIEQEMREAGYRPLADHDWLERQSFLIFTAD